MRASVLFLLWTSIITFGIYAIMNTYLGYWSTDIDVFSFVISGFFFFLYMGEKLERLLLSDFVKTMEKKHWLKKCKEEADATLFKRVLQAVEKYEEEQKKVIDLEIKNSEEERRKSIEEKRIKEELKAKVERSF